MLPRRPKGCQYGSGQRDDQVTEGCEQVLCIQRAHELSARGLRVAGSLQKSTEVMKTMQKTPEIQVTTWELSKEMMKAGIIEDMLKDTFESLDDQEEMEEEV
ncbi:Charged multivesicular body protein 3 [Tupaia chinensis]|uniref:Charged multivesicular body protein 3 n=1 Tax=Tupaia chinensis TaxID=246437 RepID=L9JZE8_TUPCH|nr:Charged multivesicular body protein 3 [Tupaia chinensis]